MRYLGIDYGGKKVGLAISDGAGSFAFPLVVLNNSSELIPELVKICKQNKIEEIIVGESKNYAGEENQIMKEIKPFAHNLEDKLGLPVHMHPEFLTSVEAERLQGKNDMHDASAAALILKSYLDTHTNQRM